MKYSEIALLVIAAKECGLVKTNAKFWAKYSNIEEFKKLVENNPSVKVTADRLEHELAVLSDDYGVICPFDKSFPLINENVTKNSEKPVTLFYRGAIDLLANMNQNVAVIGVTEPEEQVVEREKVIVKKLVDNNQIIVSGLAKGCDTVAHQTCISNGGKTIAILPSPVNKVLPTENQQLVEKIIESGGLLISEYYQQPSSRFEAIGRFIERDRLQAMFSKAIVLVASYRKDEGDSGSRHAMLAAEHYKIKRFAMFNPTSDQGNPQFGLNFDLLKYESNAVSLFKKSSLLEISNYQIESLNYRKQTKDDVHDNDQLSLF